MSKLYNTKVRTNIYDYLWDVSVSHLSLHPVHSLDGTLGEVLIFPLIHRHRGHGYIRIHTIAMYGSVGWTQESGEIGKQTGAGFMDRG